MIVFPLRRWAVCYRGPDLKHVIARRYFTRSGARNATARWQFLHSPDKSKYFYYYVGTGK